MATAAAGARKRDLDPDWRDSLRTSIRNLITRCGGAALLALACALALALATHDTTDPALMTAAGGPPSNWLGLPGAFASDVLLLLFGLASALLLPPLALAGLRLLHLKSAARIGRAMLVATAGASLLAFAVSLSNPSGVSGLPSGWGGIIGMGGAGAVDAGLDLINNPSIVGPARLTLLILLGLAGLALSYFSLALQPEEKGWASGLLRREPREPKVTPRRTMEGADERVPNAAPPKSRPTVAVTEPSRTIAPAKAAGIRKSGAQPSLALGDNYQLPTVDLLTPPPASGKTQIDRAGLERNARLLESVLEDFHVRGDIVEVRPGPVVTMYELEPASGIKASRVIQLADDIARNMSALSARVATIPGRSVIGIELPNPRPRGVVLRSSSPAPRSRPQCAAAAGSWARISRATPVVADLAPMPHLLVAGTTDRASRWPQLHDPVSALPADARAVPDDHDRSQAFGIELVPGHPPFAGAGRDRARQGDPGAQMDRRADGRSASHDASIGVRQLSSFNARVREAKQKGRQLGAACRPATTPKRPAESTRRGARNMTSAADCGDRRRACRPDDDRGKEVDS
jgi:S-DNA-T family DNA segregation ATPase FtsK/SpoIIIE